MHPRGEPEDNRLLIAALSGRALAQAARRAGYRPIVLDAFGDLDMREAADAWATLPLDSDWRFEWQALLEAAARLAPPPVPLIWASGFERTPALLDRLAQGRPLLGNDAAAIRRAKDVPCLQTLARKLGIAVPETQLDPPGDPQGWLVKRLAGAGGGHVRPAHLATGRPGEHYWQRLIPGEPVSAMVLGAGRTSRLIGCSWQWPDPSRAGQSYRFAGVAAPATALNETVGRPACALIEALGLKGLVSVDMIAGADGPLLLEVNPRPGASLDAYEQITTRPLLRLHVEACGGVLPDAAELLRPGTAAASQIVYANLAGRLPRSGRWAWPEWTADRGAPGTVVPAAGPLCTVLATGRDVGQVKAVVERRAAEIAGLFVRAVQAGPRASAAGVTTREA